MAVKYWYVANNGSGTWATNANWYFGPGGTGGVAGIPTSSDDAIVDDSSGSGTLTIGGTSSCSSLDASIFNGTVAGAGALNITTKSVDSIPILYLGGTWNYTGTISFLGVAISGWIYGNGRTHRGNVTVNAPSRTFAFEGDWISTGLFLLTSGNVFGYYVSFGAMSLSNSNTRRFDCYILGLSGTGTILSVATQTNLTWSVSEIYLTSVLSIAKVVSLSNLVCCDILYLQGAGASTTTITAGATSLIKPQVYIQKLDGTVTFGTSTVYRLEFTEGSAITWAGTSVMTILYDLILCNSMSVTFSSSINFTEDGIFRTFNKQFVGNLTVSSFASLYVFGDYNSTSTSTSAINLPTGGNVYFYGNVFLPSGTIIIGPNNAYLFNYQTLTCTRISLTGGVLFIGGEVDVSTVAISNSEITVLPAGPYTYNSVVIGVLSGKPIININTSLLGSGGTGRSVNLGNSTVNLNGSSGTLWSLTNDGNLAVGGGDYTINITDKSGGYVAFNASAGGITYNRLVLNRGGVNPQTEIQGAGTYNQFVSLTTVFSYILFDSGQTVYFNRPPEFGNWSTQTYISSTSTSNVTFVFDYQNSNPIVLSNNIIIAEITASPTNTWYAVNSSSGGGDLNFIYQMPPRRLGVGGAG
jgi:hypothetical protein